MPTRTYLVPGLKMTVGAAGPPQTKSAPCSATCAPSTTSEPELTELSALALRFSVKALQHDLLTNDGKGKDGTAPVRIKDYNKGRVPAVTGVVDFGLAQCTSDMLDDPNFPTLPFADDPVAKSQELISTLRAMPSPPAPIPFLLGILMQESGLKHFREPKGADQDS